MRFLLAALIFLTTSLSAQARTLEAGSIWGSGEIGPALRLSSALGGSSGYFLAGVAGEYVVNKNLGVIADFTIGNLGFLGSVPIRLRPGVRYHFTNLALPVSPYGQAQFSIGGLRNVLGANLWTMGVRFGGGADYFLTSKLSVGGQIGIELGSTLNSERSAFFGTAELLFVASYAFFGPTESVAETPAAPTNESEKK